MTHKEAIEWLTGARSNINVITQQPVETWEARIYEADAWATQQAYWIVKAHTDGLTKECEK